MRDPTPGEPKPGPDYATKRAHLIEKLKRFDAETTGREARRQEIVDRIQLCEQRLDLESRGPDEAVPTGA